MRSSGISLYDITSNVTIDKSVIKSTNLHAIHLSPVYREGDNNQIRIMTSTFRFCDASDYHYIKPGEVYYFFGYEASDQFGCRRWIKTDSGYSITLHVSTAPTRRNTPNIKASFYEGDEISTDQRIATFTGKPKLSIIILYSQYILPYFVCLSLILSQQTNTVRSFWQIFNNNTWPKPLLYQKETLV